MLELLALNPTGMFTFGHMDVIPLSNQGLVFLQGHDVDNNRSNGAGKSSLLNAIKEIIFGKNDTGKSGNSVTLKHDNWKHGHFGVLWLCKDGINWRIMDVRKWKLQPPSGVTGDSTITKLGNKYTGTDYFVERWDGNCWVDERPTSSVNKRSIDARKFVIEELLNMTYDQFCALVCIGQKSKSSLILGTSSEREKIIQAIVDVSTWNIGASIAKDIYNEKEILLSNLQSQLSGMITTLDSMIVPDDNYINNINIELDNTIKLMLKLDKDKNEILREIDLLKNKYKDCDSFNDQYQILLAEQKHITDEFNNFKQSSIPDELNNLININNELNANISYLIQQNKKLEDNIGDGKCPTCGQNVDYTIIINEIDSNNTKIKELKIKYDNNTKIIDDMKDKYNKLIEKELEDARNKYNNSISKLEEAKLKLQENKNKFDQIDSELQSLNNKYKYICNEIDTHNKLIIQYKKQLEDINKMINNYNILNNNISELNNNINNLNMEIDNIRWIERNFKKIKIQEYNSAIDRLNVLISDKIYKLWGANLNVRLVTAKENVKGNSIISKLDVLIDTKYKSNVPIEMYSGGETKSIVIAAFLACIELASENGIKLNFCAIDEIDNGLDDVGVDGLVESFRMVNNVIPTCIIISHNTRLLNVMNFDKIWTVKKENEISTVKYGV